MGDLRVFTIIAIYICERLRRWELIRIPDIRPRRETIAVGLSVLHYMSPVLYFTLKKRWRSNISLYLLVTKCKYSSCLGHDNSASSRALLFSNCAQFKTVFIPYAKRYQEQTKILKSNVLLYCWQFFLNISFTFVRFTTALVDIVPSQQLY